MTGRNGHSTVVEMPGVSTSRTRRRFRRIATVLACLLSLSVAAPATAAAQNPPGVTWLVTWWNPDRGDAMVSGTLAGDSDARNSGYRQRSMEGNAFIFPVQGTVALYQYWHAGRGDNFLAASPDGNWSAVVAGYVRVRVEGYAFPYQANGTVPLYTLWNPVTQDNLSTATAQGYADAVNAGYSFVRVEAYVLPYPLS
ncbi:hypothetical protein [Actinokineospora sp. NBRC 105648]|uniref:hypothetical protein n=1 Tax=Actinokineospora sp. NBRC 105648 TaxID=3032206 RepID=UPI002554D260|nr:hypothetical protein [Actinokineospora sp. NBRC 105648]